MTEPREDELDWEHGSFADYATEDDVQLTVDADQYLAESEEEGEDA